MCVGFPLYFVLWHPLPSWGQDKNVLVRLLDPKPPQLRVRYDGNMCRKADCQRSSVTGCVRRIFCGWNLCCRWRIHFRAWGCDWWVRPIPSPLHIVLSDLEVAGLSPSLQTVSRASLLMWVSKEFPVEEIRCWRKAVSHSRCLGVCGGQVWGCRGVDNDVSSCHKLKAIKFRVYPV